MSIPGSASPLFLASTAAAGAYEIPRSLRFNSADSAYLSKNFSSAGNRKTWSLSFWTKRCFKPSFYQSYFINRDNASYNLRINDPAASPTFYLAFASGVALTSTAVYRDFSAWMHVVIVYDSTDSTSADRVRLYVNGERQTFSSGTYPSLNLDSEFNNSGNHGIGYFNGNTALDAYLADYQFVDGVSGLTAADFGEYDDNNVWQPIEYAGTYGTNGFHLNFSDTSSNSALGTDSSGAGNNWSVNNLITSSTTGFNLDVSSSPFVDVGTSLTITNVGTTVSTTTAATNSLNLTTVANFTVAGYIKTSSMNIPSNYTIDYFYDSAGTQAHANVNVVFDFGTNDLQDYADSTGNSHSFAGFAYTAASGWNHVRVSNTGVWVNGTRLGNSPSGIPGSSGKVLTLGAYSDGNYKWNGRIGPFRVAAKDLGAPPSGGLVANSNGKLSTIIAANADSDALRDSPVNGDSANDTGAGGEITGNYATFNPLFSVGSPSTSEGNLKVVTSGSAGCHIGATIAFPTSGKWYLEVTQDSGTYAIVGVIGTENTFSSSTYLYQYAESYVMYNQSGALMGSNSGSSTGSGATFTNGDCIGIALDMDNQQLRFYKNNTQLGGFNSVTTSKRLVFAVSDHDSSSTAFTLNAGQRAFKYAAPSNFKALCTANLPDPTIADGSTAFDAKTFTANNGTQTISGLNFSPDLVWTKSRANAYAHQLWDQVRGANKALMPNETSAEANLAGSLAFTSDGFTSGTNNNANYGSGGSIAWAWDAGDNSNHTYAVTVANTGSGNKYYADGALQPTLTLAEGSTYKFDQSSGTNSTHPLRFSTTSDGTHGGGSEYTTGVTTSGTPGSAGAYTQIVIAASAPTLYAYCTNHSGMGFQVNTSDTAGYTIPVGSASSGVPSISSRIQADPSKGFSIVSYTATSSTGTIGHGLNAAPAFVLCKRRDSAGDWWAGHVGAGWTKGAYLQVADAFAANAGWWNNTAPDSNVVTLGTYPTSGSTSATYIAYCFAPVEGYSAFGSYVGNNDADGTFVYLGFTPKLVLLKRTNTSGTAWVMFDTERSPSNVIIDWLRPNGANSESTNNKFDIVSNGIKFRKSDSFSNDSAGTFIYAAWASHPFKTSRAR